MFLALSLLSTSGAAGFELSAGAGANLVGDTFVVAPSSSFSVEIWYNPSGHTGQVIASSLALAYDRTNGIGDAATRLDHKLSFTSFSEVSGPNGEAWGIFPDAAHVIQRAAAEAIHTGHNYDYISGAARPYVTYAVTAKGGPQDYVTLPSTPFRVAVATFTSNLVGGEVYGDSTTEAGLFMSHQGDRGAGLAPQLGASGWASNVHDARTAGSSKYKVAAVPEPATLAAIAMGVAALAGRKRRNR